jgi:diguanylate cyclase (GGDEF)-like protein
MNPRSLVERLGQAVREAHRPVLVVLSGHRVGTRCELSEGVMVGRDPTCGVCLPDTGVSWHHARIDHRGGAWAVLDLESTNGTSVNGEAITVKELQAGDKLVFGQTVVRFELRDPADQEYDQEVDKLLSIDDLSGLYLRRRFDAELLTLIAAAEREGRPLGLLVMDLDGVKQINDTHGHLFGAYVIGEAGHLIKDLIDGNGIGTRFGGDEYVAALPDHDLEATRAVGERIRSTIESHRFEREGIELHPGISIGVAAFPQSAVDAQTLFHAGDEALYRAKRAGKNRVCT